MKSLTTTLFILFGISIFAQSYDYSKFRYPDVKIKALGTSFELNGYTNSDFLTNKNSLSGRYYIQGFHSILENSKKKQKFTIYNGMHQFQFWNLSNSSSNETALDLGIRSFSRNYKGDDSVKIFGLSNKFFEIDYAISSNSRYSSSKNDLRKNNSLKTNFSIQVPLKFGIGRIEPLDQLFNAQFMVDDLINEGLLKEKLSEEKMFELAQLMSKVRVNRVFDDRKSTIYQLTEISNWLEANGVDMNINSFAIINDNRYFNIALERNHGNRLSFGLIPTFNYEYETSTTDGNSNGSNVYKITSGAAVIEFNSSKSISKTMSSSFNIGIAHNYLVSNYRSQFNDTIKPTSISANYSLYFNPNSRSLYGISIASNMGITNFGKNNLNIGTKLFARHFINYRTNIYASLSSTLNLTSIEGNNFKNYYYTLDENTLFNFTNQNERVFNEGRNLSINVYLGLNYTIF
jgi:hypothetical protein